MSGGIAYVFDEKTIWKWFMQYGNGSFRNIGRWWFKQIETIN
jgi:hypothetical protein